MQTVLPPWISPKRTDNPTQYTLEDMKHLEPRSLNTVFLKNFILGSIDSPTPPTGSFLRTNTGGFFLTNTGGRFLV